MHDYGDDDDDVDDNGENTFSTRGLLVEEAPRLMHVAFTLLQQLRRVIFVVFAPSTHTHNVRETHLLLFN